MRPPPNRLEWYTLPGKRRPYVFEPESIPHSKPMLVDIHTHIQQHDLAEHCQIVQRAVDADVAVIVAAGTSVDDSRAATDLAELSSVVRAGVGVHPDQIEAPVTDDDLRVISELAQRPEVVVMSEIGIDFLRDQPSQDHQQDAFAAQIEIAKSEQLPVVFHVREQSDDLTSTAARDVALAILAESDIGDIGGAAHYFQGDYDYAQRLLDLGIHISFAKPLMRSAELQDVARRIPLHSIVLETDAYPQPFKKRRDKWTEPKDVRQVAEFLAQLRGIEFPAVANQTTENATKLMRAMALPDPQVQPKPASARLLDS